MIIKSNKDIISYLNNISMWEIKTLDSKIKCDILTSTIKLELEGVKRNKIIDRQVLSILATIEKIKNSFNIIKDVKTKTIRISSRGEDRVANYLTSLNINFIREKEFKDLVGDSNTCLRFDFYLPENKLCIEFDGQQHFEYIEEFDKGDHSKLIKRQKYDTLKNEYCYMNGLQIVRIKYTQEDKIELILNSVLKGNIIQKQNYTKSNKKDNIKTDLRSLRKTMNITNTKTGLFKLLKELTVLRKDLKGNLKGMGTALMTDLSKKIRLYENRTSK